MPSANQRDGASTSSDTPAIVVGLGASAGGIKSLAEFFRHVSADESAAYVVILHLSPDHESRLAEILQQTSPVPVTQVRESVTLRPRQAYVISPNQSLRIDDGVLVVDEATRQERKAPVDLFFRTLAGGYGAASVAIVLSGTGSDGSNGLKRMKEFGGLTIVQDPLEAEFQEMPANSIATGLVDYVMSVKEMPRRIIEYRQRLGTIPAQLPADPPDSDQTAVTAADVRTAQEWRDILTLLRVRTGQDFSNYKPATIRRRVQRRLGVRGVSTLAEYVQVMREHPDEAVLLMKELLISVTNFVRDPEAFQVLERDVVPALFERHGSGDQIRIWSAGCATGEEAYSLAMLFAERAGTVRDAPTIQVFASDLDEQAIATARDGLYSEADVADLSAGRLARFFQREPGGYRVRRDLREMVLFAHHNVIRDPPFSHVDLIACRNLLIYLNRSIQERLIETFHFALRPGGYLFLGTSETADGGDDLFAVVDKSAHIFESRTVTSRPSLALADRAIPAAPPYPRALEPRPLERISPGELHLRLLEQYAPPSFVVNEDYTLMHVSPGAAAFLQVTPGEPSRDIFKVVHEDLRADLRTALQMAARDRAAVVISGVRVHLPEGDKALRLTARPALREDSTPRGYFLIVLEEKEDGAAPAAIRITSRAEPESRQLTEELEQVRGRLRSTVEQYETQVEEARAANEELQAMNEELRSSAEELETSREELRSSNEELTTVNEELKIKIEELRLTNNDFQNLINAADIAAIFLDRSLRVKLSTPRAQQIFNLLPADIGRRLSDITSRLLYEPFHDDTLRVLDRLHTVEREVQTREGRWFLMRILPYRTADDRIEGVAMTFHDITLRRHAETRLHAGEERLRLLIDSAVDYAIFTMSSDGVIDSWNTGAERMFGYGGDEIIGQDGAILFTPEDRMAGVPGEELAVAHEKGRALDERWHLRKDGTRFFCSGVTTRLGNDDTVVGYAKIARDLTAGRESQTALQQAHADLEARVDHRTRQLLAEIERRGAAQQEVSALLRRLVTAQEDLRRRISRDLHDQLGQQLTALRLALERHREHCRGEATADLERAQQLTREIDGAIDFLAWELRPTVLDDLGLAAALPRYVEEWSAHHGISARFENGGHIQGRLDSEIETTFYRVAQEALNNVAKHAQATSVDVVLDRRDGELLLVVEDDGIGFDIGAPDVRDNGIGLAGMRERAALAGATLQVESTPGKGTSVYLRRPIAEAATSS
ncbi:MAG TPA: CheR family methyltransferase [Vicinamibacterales bacterium]|nr:CheR family methyltransferase [Vicinamibacterales bacterium]